jgi:hypothetical protein
MPTPEIKAVINAARQYESDEAKLTLLKAQKAQCQSQIFSINTQIAEVVDLVAISKAALKAAANEI